MAARAGARLTLAHWNHQSPETVSADSARRHGHPVPRFEPSIDLVNDSVAVRPVLVIPHEPRRAALVQRNDTWRGPERGRAAVDFQLVDLVIRRDGNVNHTWDENLPIYPPPEFCAPKAIAFPLCGKQGEPASASAAKVLESSNGTPVRQALDAAS
jgi:hypothetical protein